MHSYCSLGKKSFIAKLRKRDFCKKKDEKALISWQANLLVHSAFITPRHNDNIFNLFITVKIHRKYLKLLKRKNADKCALFSKYNVTNLSFQ